MIIIALGNEPLKVVQKHSKDPSLMWEKLITRYAGKNTSNKLTLLNEVFSKSFSMGEIMCDYIGDLETAFTKLDNAGIPLTEIIQVAVLLGSNKNCPEYEAMVAAMQTMDEDKKTWDTVCTRLIEEYKDRFESPRGGRIQSGTAAYAGQKSFTTHTTCTYCKKKNHTAQDCFNNPNSKRFKGGKKESYILERVQKQF